MFSYHRRPASCGNNIQSRLARCSVPDASRVAAKECSPWRKPWVTGRSPQPAPEGRKNMSHTSGNILLHFIFSTRGRRPLIGPEFRQNLFAYLGGIVRELEGTALA